MYMCVCIYIIKDNDRNLITEEDYVRLSHELIMSSLSIFCKFSSSLSLLLSSFFLYRYDVFAIEYQGKMCTYIYIYMDVLFVQS